MNRVVGDVWVVYLVRHARPAAPVDGVASLEPSRAAVVGVYSTEGRAEAAATKARRHDADYDTLVEACEVQS